MAFPTAAVPKAWQRDPNNARIASEKRYTKGSGKNRGKVPRGPGGDGNVISSTSESCFARKKA